LSKYLFIDAHRAEFHVVDLCRVGGVSTSGLYDWQARQETGPSDAERLEAELVAEIRAIHAAPAAPTAAREWSAPCTSRATE